MNERNNVLKIESSHEKGHCLLGSSGRSSTSVPKEGKPELQISKPTLWSSCTCPCSLLTPEMPFFPPPVNQRSHWPFGFWTLSAIVFKYKWKNWHSDITAQTRAHFFWVHYYEMGPFSECCKHQVPNCDWTLELTERNRDRELHLVRALWLSFLGSATQGTSAGTVCTHSTIFTF